MYKISVNNNLDIKMHVNTFKRIEMIIHDPLSSGFLEAIKAMVYSGLFAKSCQHNGVSSQLYCLRWAVVWTWHLHLYKQKRQQQFAMGANIYFSQGWLVTRAFSFVFLDIQIYSYIYSNLNTSVIVIFFDDQN